MQIGKDKDGKSERVRKFRIAVNGIDRAQLARPQFKKTSAQGVGRFYRTIYSDEACAIYETLAADGAGTGRYYVTAHQRDLRDIIAELGLMPRENMKYAPYRKHSDERGRWHRVGIRKPEL